MKIAYFGLAAASFVSACADTPPPAPAPATTISSATNTVTPGSQEDLVANVGDRVFFDYDRSSLSPEAQAILARQAAWLNKYPQVNVQVAGNCDERGTEDYNIALGNRRAMTTSQYLQAQGIGRPRITTISYGKDRPVALGSDEAAWAQNRNAITSVK